jgi:nitrogen-specific signal transduction histidine kinase
MDKGLNQELASELKKQIAEHEDWLVKRILFYAKKNAYTAYTSTLEEAWRASIVGLSKPLLDTPSTSFWMPELHPHFDFKSDHYAQFGIVEAKKHRERGIDLIMFLGLFKYYRQAYEDLLFKIDMSLTDVKACRTFIKRYFDRVELGFIDGWMALSGEGINQEMADANRRLTNAKSLYLTTLESLTQPVMVFSETNEVKVMNEAAAELFAGSSSPGAVYYGGQKVKVSPLLLKSVEEFFKSHKQSGDVSISMGGRIFDVSFSRMKDVSGKFIGLAVIMNDITDKCNTEGYLKESEALRKAFMEGIDAAAFVLDMDVRRVADYNSRAEELFAGCDFINSEPVFYEMQGGKGTSMYDLAESSINNEERFVEICRIGHKPVRLFSVEVWFHSKRHKILIIFDISREKMLEKRANHLQHLEILGDIAGSLPDMLGDSVNDLASIVNMAKTSDCSDEDIDRAINKVNEVKEVIDALESLVHYETETACIDMNQLIKNCIILTRDKWYPYADFGVRLGNGNKGIHCAPDEMGQVFLNLLVNAAYAVRKKFEADGERGSINIASRTIGSFFEVKLSDTGIGIKKEDYTRIFDQGFTTKQLGRVTGNGLAIVYDIVVKRHKGTIEFKSVEGKGTEFTLKLPIK